MTIPRANIEVVNDAALTTPVFITSLEIALRLQTGLSSWLDAKYAADYGVTNLISSCGSINTDANGAEMVATITGGVGHETIWYPTVDGQNGIRTGYDTAGVVALNRVTMLGNPQWALPVPPWYVCVVAKWELPATLSTLWSTNDQTTRHALACTNTGIIRWYSNFSTVLTSSVAGINDGVTPAMWEVTWDGTTIVVSRNKVAVITATPAMPALTDRTIRLNSVNTGTVNGANPGLGWWESVIVGKTLDPAFIAAARAVVHERHPSWFTLP